MNKCIQTQKSHESMPVQNNYVTITYIICCQLNTACHRYDIGNVVKRFKSGRVDELHIR